MENNKLIAEALLELARSSKTTLIEVAEDKELIKAAAKLGIVLPSPDLAVLKTVYAEVDKVNRNGVVLPRKAVEKGLPTLVGKQINWEHDGAGRICGYIIDAKVNGNLIEIIGVVFKSLFPEEMDAVVEKFSEKKLTVSFEIWNRNPETGESVVHELANGDRSLDPILFHGCGLLLNNNPACPKAVVYKLVASKEIDNAEKIVERIFEDNLICASMAITEPKCQNCKTCTCKHEEEIVEEIIKTETEIKAEEVSVETQTATTPVVESEPKVEEPKVEAKTEEIVKVEETKTEEPTAEEKVEPKVDDASTVIVHQELNKVDESTPTGEVISTEVKTEQTVVDESGKEVMKVEEVVKTVVTYTFEQLQEEMAKVKEEKDKEISALKEEVDGLKKELELKSQEIAKLTIVEEPVVEKKLDVGSVEVEKVSEVKKQAKNINDIIAAKHNQ